MSALTQALARLTFLVAFCAVLGALVGGPLGLVLTVAVKVFLP